MSKYEKFVMYFSVSIELLINFLTHRIVIAFIFYFIGYINAK